MKLSCQSLPNFCLETNVCSSKLTLSTTERGVRLSHYVQKLGIMFNNYKKGCKHQSRKLLFCILTYFHMTVYQIIFEPITTHHRSADLILQLGKKVVKPGHHLGDPICCAHAHPPFQTPLPKIFKNCFLRNKSYFTTLTFRGTFTK